MSPPPSKSPEREARENRWREWMAAAQDGDAKAYEQLLQELLPEVRSLVRRRMSGSSEEAAVEDNVDPHLAAARASTATRWLAAHPEIPAKKLRAESRAFYDPVASNASPEGRSQNRRVVIRLVP